jgi:hypothetical protein
MLRLLVIVFCVCCGVTIQAFSQGEDNSLKGVPAKDRIVTGGGLGLSFGSYQDFFSVSPVIGYMLTKKLVGGTGVTYRYTKYKYYTPSIKLNDYAVNPFLRYTVYKTIFVQAEYEYLNYELPIDNVNTIRQNFNSFLAGGGVIQPISPKASFYVMALYNFSYTAPVVGRYSPYDSPFVIRAGINIGNIGF